ncbi:MAG: vanadium-dependent haloperoxidase [Bryobacteraceae bacterium]
MKKLFSGLHSRNSRTTDSRSAAKSAEFFFPLIARCAACALIASIAFADAVTDWNTIMRDAVRSEGAQHQARYAAITHLAMYEAVNSITKGYQPYLTSIAASPQASPESAAIAAAHHVLSTYFPASKATFDAARLSSLAAIPDGPAKAAGIAVGEAAAAAIIAHRANDGAATPVPYTPKNGVGYWQPTPPMFGAAVGANWGKVLPFGIARADEFRPGPPPALTSTAYRRDYREVKRMGDLYSTARPDDRTDLARYMSMTSPTQIWNHLAVQLSAAEGLTLPENARAFALMNMAVADASIALFEAKYFYEFWRPLTAIRAGDIDGNPRTEGNAGFTSLINAPAYPSYPSGFGSFSNAARYVLERLFGRGRHSIALAPNPAVPNMNLEYKKLRHVTDDIDDARVYGGIHFRFEQEEAEVQGERVARCILQRQLRPTCPGRCEVEQ